MNGLDGASQKHFASTLSDVGRQRGSHLPVIDDAGRRYPERRKSGRVGLVRGDFVAPDELESVDSVGPPPLGDLGECLPLAFADRNDELAS
jgi:hypothetical protein